MRVSVTEAKQKFSHILNCAIVGVTVVITKRGKPVAKLVGIRPKAGTRRKFRVGSAKGKFTVPDDFNDPLPKEIEDLFYK
ncbi:MAG: type II toxin-antitoxin system prevent-host-death family antitoxin [Terriglobales bacterium]|jgi:prevent-host-death family protein